MFHSRSLTLSTRKCILSNYNKKQKLGAFRTACLHTNNLCACTYMYIHAICNCVSTFSTSHDVLVQKSLKSYALILVYCFFFWFSQLFFIGVRIEHTWLHICTVVERAKLHVWAWYTYNFEYVWVIPISLPKQWKQLPLYLHR